MSAICQILSCSVLASLLWPSFVLPAETAGILGYVGPGAGLSMLGALFAVVCVIALALLGPLLYPIRLIRSMLRKHREQKGVQRLP